MFPKKKILSFSSAFLLLAVLINILIIKIAYTSSLDFYWSLLFSIPLLAFSIYYYKMVSKRRIKYTMINIDSGKLYENNATIISSNTKSYELNVVFGNSHCATPYSSGIICIDADSVPKQNNLIHKENDFSKNLREDINSIDEHRDDMIWQINPGYPGCRDHNFNFNRELFSLNASRPCVKMIELRLPASIKKHNIPGKRNIYSDAVIGLKYPGIILKPINKHTAFGSAEGMAIFLDSLRQLSGKKPVGIRMCISDKNEFHKICYALRKTEVIPDYIVIENDINVYNVLNHDEICLYEALQFATAALELYGLKSNIKIIAAAEIYSPLDVIKLVTLGADAISIKNKFRSSHDHHNPENSESNNFLKESRAHFEHVLLNEIIKIMRAWGYKSIKDITLPVFFHNIEPQQSWSFPKAVNNDPVVEAKKPLVRSVKQPHHNRAKRRPEVSFS